MTTRRAGGLPGFSSLNGDQFTGRPNSSGEPKKEIWSSLLDGVSTGKKLPEKNILILGGTPESQKDFLESLSNDHTSKRRPPDRQHSKKPPIANQYALGYTYQDVLDADQEDILARLSLYLLATPTSAFASLLKPLLTTKTLPHTLLIILLDWSKPWTWVRELYQWVRILRELVQSLDDDCKDVLEENIVEWRDRRRNLEREGMSASGGSKGPGSAIAGGQSTEDMVALPLGPGEWDEPLGLPLCLVCHSADRIETLEKERGWREEKFDFIQQYLRTILLKHGAGLIYTGPSANTTMVPIPNPSGAMSTTSDASPLQTLIHAALGIHSTMKRRSLRHNVVDKDRVLVPPGWDSWAKIRVIREGFQIEEISRLWSDDIARPLHDKRAAQDVEDAEDAQPTENDTTNGTHTMEEANKAAESVAIYEETIADPTAGSSALNGLKGLRQPGIEIKTEDYQEFLAKQATILEKLKLEDEAEAKSKNSKERKVVSSTATGFIDRGDGNRGAVQDYIGPVQVNMGGVSVNAEDMIRRMKDRPQDRDTRESTPVPVSAIEEPEWNNEKLASFFRDLSKRPTGGSATNSPRR